MLEAIDRDSGVNGFVAYKQLTQVSVIILLNVIKDLFILE